MTKDKILQKICATTGKTKRKMVSVHEYVLLFQYCYKLFTNMS